MAIAQVGPVTSAVEALAGVVGAGIVLGGFAFGFCRMARGSPRRMLEAHVLTDGYFGGAIAVLLALIDIAVWYV